MISKTSPDSKQLIIQTAELIDLMTPTNIGKLRLAEFEGDLLVGQTLNWFFTRWRIFLKKTFGNPTIEDLVTLQLHGKNADNLYRSMCLVAGISSGEIIPMTPAQWGDDFRAKFVSAFGNTWNAVITIGCLNENFDRWIDQYGGGRGDALQPVTH